MISELIELRHDMRKAGVEHWLKVEAPIAKIASDFTKEDKLVVNFYEKNGSPAINYWTETTEDSTRLNWKINSKNFFPFKRVKSFSEIDNAIMLTIYNFFNATKNLNNGESFLFRNFLSKHKLTSKESIVELVEKFPHDNNPVGSLEIRFNNQTLVDSEKDLESIRQMVVGNIDLSKQSSEAGNNTDIFGLPMTEDEKDTWGAKVFNNNIFAVKKERQTLRRHGMRMTMYPVSPEARFHLVNPVAKWWTDNKDKLWTYWGKTILAIRPSIETFQHFQQSKSEDIEWEDDPFSKLTQKFLKGEDAEFADQLSHLTTSLKQDNVVDVGQTTVGLLIIKDDGNKNITSFKSYRFAFQEWMESLKLWKALGTTECSFVDKEKNRISPIISTREFYRKFAISDADLPRILDLRFGTNREAEMAANYLLKRIFGFYSSLIRQNILTVSKNHFLNQIQASSNLRTDHKFRGHFIPSILRILSGRIELNKERLPMIEADGTKVPDIENSTPYLLGCLLVLASKLQSTYHFELERQSGNKTNFVPILSNNFDRTMRSPQIGIRNALSSAKPFRAYAIGYNGKTYTRRIVRAMDKIINQLGVENNRNIIANKLPVSFDISQQAQFTLGCYRDADSIIEEFIPANNEQVTA